ncbi:GNAT family N-acetyltransferase [Marinactinospora thermotolerans]|uniref:GNAT family N-acetyltransferase n=1 Tax=Marinactinospora thermotolerans TaxID=531310 RepID=UPI003D8E18B4
MSLHIRTATDDDLEAVVGLRIAAEERLHAAGIDQWHDRERGIRNLREGIHDGVTSVVTTPAGEVVATVTLAGPDPDWWHEEDDPESALYLYKLMINDDWRGTGLGDEILDWACQQAQDRGKSSVRLDCWRTNVALQKYYKDRGFRHLRTETAPGRGSGALFEREVGVRTATSRHLSV